MEYTVHFQKGTRVGARSLRMIHVEADGAPEAIKLAKVEFAAEGLPALGYKLTRVDHFEGSRIVRDIG